MIALGGNCFIVIVIHPEDPNLTPSHVSLSISASNSTQVVGGYLAFIGFFCGQAGLALMASVNVAGLMQWYKFLEGEALVLLAPGVLGGVFLYYSVGKFRHMAVLPSCIALLLVVFYTLLYCSGTTLKEAMDNGWINEAMETPVW